MKTVSPQRLSYIITYKSPGKEKEVRPYSLIIDEAFPKKVILDEGGNSLFEERVEGNLMFGLLRAGDTLVHSRFEVKENIMEVQMTTFNLNPSRTFEAAKIIQADYHPTSVQSCILIKY